MQKERNLLRSYSVKLCWMIVCCFGIFNQSLANDRPYTIRYDTIVHGGVLVAGNTNVTRNYLAPVSSYIDIDGDGSTYNSSSEDVTIPPGATVIKAFLYWQSTKNYGPTSFPPGFNTSVLFKTPGGAYTSLAPDVTDIATAGYYWLGIKDVTSMVQTSGTYTVANIMAQPVPPGTNGYPPFAGWSLWIAYTTPAEPNWYRIVLVDGTKYVTAGSNDITVDGFRVVNNPSVPIDGEAGWFVGNANFDWGDAMTYTNNTTSTTQFFSNGTNPMFNVLNESRTYKGLPVLNPRNPASGPKYYNSSIYNPPGETRVNVDFPWFDLDVVDLSAIMTRGQTSFTLKFYPQGGGVTGCGQTYAGCDDWNNPGYVYAKIRTGITVSDAKNTAIPRPAINSSLPLDGAGGNPPAFSGKGPEEENLGATNSVLIKTLPLEAELYYDYGAGPVLITAGTTIPALDPSKLTIKFLNNVAGSTFFTYAMISADGVEDPVGAVYLLTWPPPPLPVTLQQFDAKLVQQQAQLSWITASEINTAWFEIQKRQGNDAWTIAGKIAAAGNSTTPRNYQFTDNATNSGSWQYRLRMLDADGTESFSAVKLLNIGSQQAVVISPNPAKGTVALSFSEADNQPKEISFYNASGGLVLSATIPAGQLRRQFDVVHLPAGLYNVVVRGRQTTHQLKLILK
ncbi:T9SS type A sorting domain-containing protein [Pseudoflavitalea sp. G-6-1-2]|uniref:T9SS type A sorting domain-containing protein n=1 Tax=Pseudoflavitalea sp. G-6-1-2 TaxID=2728841 RepID=UPI00146ACD39|nr:T9SS type A sorting domain-containing protein [Pseudoflavitalea sp. G-6-1-2]NML22761.1 T9SS type A sorting domain-containing protein [Pseudoflavitalea sp. G-6-1-2]